MKSIILIDGNSFADTRVIENLVVAGEDLVRVYSKKNKEKLIISDYIIENNLGRFLEMPEQNIVLETTHYFVIPANFNYGKESGTTGRDEFQSAMAKFSKGDIEVHKLLMMINSTSAIELDFIVK